MTFLNNYALSLFALLSGLLLMMLIPYWLAFLVLLPMLLLVMINAYQAYPKQFTLVFQFFTEFMGFCIMLTFFVGFMVGLGSLTT